MATLKWVEISGPEPAPGSGGDATVMTSRFLLRSRRQVPGFLWAALAIRRQVRRSPGALGVSLIAEPRKARFWTLSAWRDRAALDDFVRHSPTPRPCASTAPTCVTRASDSGRSRPWPFPSTGPMPKHALAPAQDTRPAPAWAPDVDVKTLGADPMSDQWRPRIAQVARGCSWLLGHETGRARGGARPRWGRGGRPAVTKEVACQSPGRLDAGTRSA